MSMEVQLMVAGTTSSTASLPTVLEGIEWTTEREGAPGKLTFKVLLEDDTFEEGAAVKLTVDGTSMFYGFVFTKQMDRDKIITVTAYDQLRYLQNKDTYVYEDKTASEFIQMIAEDFDLNLGEIEDTGYTIASRVEDNTTLFDMIENALDLTLSNTGEMYVLYDDCGSLTLKSLSSMYVSSGSSGYSLIDESTAENFDYTTTIDENTYDKIKLVYENEEDGTRDVYVAQDSSNINEWGILQYFDTLTDGENGESKANSLLELYNEKTKNLKITGALGNTSVRAGSMVLVSLDLGDTTVSNFMLVEKCVHKFKQNEHTMDLTLRGGGFSA